MHRPHEAIWHHLIIPTTTTADLLLIPKALHHLGFQELQHPLIPHSLDQLLWQMAPYPQAQLQATHPLQAALDLRLQLRKQTVLLRLDRQVLLVRSRMRKEDYPLDGRGGRTILEGHIMWITTRDLPAGIGPLLLEPQKLSEMKEMRTRKLSDRDIRTGRYLRIELGPIPPICSSNKQLGQILPMLLQ